MDPLAAKWMSELEMDDPALIPQWPPMNSLDQSLDHDLSFNQFSSESCSSYQSSVAQYPPEASRQTCIVKPALNQLKNKEDSRFSTFGQKSSQKPSSTSPSATIISFWNTNLLTRSAARHYGKPKYTIKAESHEMMMPVRTIDFSSTIMSPDSFEEPIWCTRNPFKKGRCRTPLQAEDHVSAERKRREKLSQQFVALSAIVPGLTKLDKASVIDSAIKYLIQLEERIKNFEEEEKKRKCEESAVVSAKRPRRCYYDDAASFGENSDNISFEHSSKAEVEVRISRGDMLLNVVCKKQSGIMVGFLSEIENFHLSVTSSSFMPFGDGMLLITAIAQMDDEFCINADDLANKIRLAILKLL